MFVCGCTRFHPCAQGSVSLPPVRAFPPVSPRPLRSRATPWPKGGAHAIRGELEAYNDEGGVQYLRTITQPFWLKVPHPRSNT